MSCDRNGYPHFDAASVINLCKPYKNILTQTKLLTIMARAINFMIFFVNATATIFTWSLRTIIA